MPCHPGGTGRGVFPRSCLESRQCFPFASNLGLRHSSSGFDFAQLPITLSISVWLWCVHRPSHALACCHPYNNPLKGSSRLILSPPPHSPPLTLILNYWGGGRALGGRRMASLVSSWQRRASTKGWCGTWHPSFAWHLAGNRTKEFYCKKRSERQEWGAAKGKWEADEPKSVCSSVCLPLFLSPASQYLVRP